MRYYSVLKPLYSGRKKRTLQPGEVLEYPDNSGQVLVEREFVVEIGEREAKRRSERAGRISDPELDKLDQLEV